MATDFVQNLQNDLYLTRWQWHFTTDNGFEYRNSDLEVIKFTIFATFCAILVRSVHYPKDHVHKKPVFSGVSSQKVQKRFTVKTATNQNGESQNGDMPKRQQKA